MKSKTAREVALDCLNSVFQDGAYANLVLPKLLSESRLDSRDTGFAQELAFGTIRWKLTYDRLLEEVSSRPIESIDLVLLNCLRLGAHQLLNTRVPAHAAISETVNLVRQHCGEKVVGFANGILRSISRNSISDWLETVTKNSSEIESFSLRYSHPEWIVLALKQSLAVDGLEGDLEDLLALNNASPKVNMVALPGLADRNEIAEASRFDSFSPFGFSLDSGNPAEMEDVRTGLVRVQDEGSQLAALALTSFRDPKPGEQWLDMCAGPGGKAALLASIAAMNEITLTANELQPHRVRLVSNALSPFQSNLQITEGDGRLIGEHQPNKYDRILIDAPCSGLGALRRRPESRWSKSAQDLKSLTQLQQELLASGLQALKPGGLLLYATCSPHLSETTAVVEKVLKGGGVSVLNLTQSMNNQFMQERLPKNRKTVQLHTQRDGTDSMFLALLTKD